MWKYLFSCICIFLLCVCVFNGYCYICCFLFLLIIPPLLTSQRFQTLCQSLRSIMVWWWRAQTSSWIVTLSMWPPCRSLKSSGTEAMRRCTQKRLMAPVRHQSMWPLALLSLLREITMEHFSGVRLSCTWDQMGQSSSQLNLHHLTLLLLTVSFPLICLLLTIINTHHWYTWMIYLCWCVFIVDKPLIQACPKRYTGVEDHFRMSMLDCDADGNPSPTLQWYYQGNLINASELLNRTHSGMYTAKFVNSIGTSETSVNITIECECIRHTWLYCNTSFTMIPTFIILKCWSVSFSFSII